MKGSLKTWPADALPTRQLIAVAVIVCGSMVICERAAAQITPPIGNPPTELEPPIGYPSTVAPSASGPYFGSPAWDMTLVPSVRFIVLTNFNSNAVLDRETGLVWARVNAKSSTFGPVGMTADAADGVCRDLTVGNRAGWRLPTLAELRTLLDFALPYQPVQPRLPAGHPFVLPATVEGLQSVYWTSDTDDSRGPGHQWALHTDSGQASSFAIHNDHGALCVRGRR